MRRIAAVLTLAVLTTTACADGPLPSGEPQADRLVPVTVQRSGGIAGVQDELTVQPDGSWGRAGRGAGTAGRLSADRNDTLTRMVADPALRAEAGRTAPRPACADALEYVLTFGEIRVAWQDCGTTPPPVANRIARFLLDGTNPR